MPGRDIARVFSKLSTPLVADACLRLKQPLRMAPVTVRPLVAGSQIAGHVLPVRHYGSVDTFLEAMTAAKPADILVIDNAGRTDEACIGDLTVLETQASGLKGLIVWGCHRDTPELLRIGFPVFSQGTCSAGPRRLDRREPEALISAKFGGFSVTRQDTVFADDDGVIFTPSKNTDEILTAARAIAKTERGQAKAIRSGRKLHDQLQFDEYLKKRSADSNYTFRKHLRAIGAAIEE
jgi:4-hydroxy-4-methyl-2-oxoglutarate aldolase